MKRAINFYSSLFSEQNQPADFRANVGLGLSASLIEERQVTKVRKSLADVEVIIRGYVGLDAYRVLLRGLLSHDPRDVAIGCRIERCYGFGAPINRQIRLSGLYLQISRAGVESRKALKRTTRFRRVAVGVKNTQILPPTQILAWAVLLHNTRWNMNNEQSRFIRWGIPGWMMFLAFLSYSAIDIILSPQSDKNGLMVFVKEIVNQTTSNSAISAAAVLLVAAAGIPLGFFIYQIYFYVRWNSPFSRDGMFPPFIEGRMNDLKRTMDGISNEEITGDIKWRIDWIEMPSFRNDHTMKWRYIENYFTEITSRLKDEGVNLYARYRYLMDLLHTLGAGLFGIYLGYLGYLLAIVKIEHYSFTILAGVSAILFAALILLLEWEDKHRREDSNENKNSSKQNITIMYLLFICIILYLGSPSPYPILYKSGHLLLRAAVVGLVISFWLYSRWKLIKDIFLRELILLIFIAGLAGVLSQVIKSFIPSSYWNVGWSIWVFLVTNLIFIRNRQNTRDDLIALQNYTIKRCLALEEKTIDESMPVREALIKLGQRLWF